MDLGITNIFIFYLRSWLILSIVIGQPSFDHRLTLAIYLTASVTKVQFEWINIQGIENLDRFILHLPRHVPRFAINKDFVLLDPPRVWSLFTQPNEHTPGVLPQVCVENIHPSMGWLRSVGSLKLQVSFAENCLFFRALLHKRPILLRSLLIQATP